MQSHLDITLAAARRDEASVTPEGKSLSPLIEGVEIRPLVTHVDERGCLFELIDERWSRRGAPVSSAYCYTIRPAT